MIINGNMAKLEKCIFGEETGNFKTRDYLKWKEEVKKELTNLKLGKTYNQKTINELYNYLNRVDIVSNTEFVLYNGEVINIEELEMLYNYIYQKNLNPKEYLKMTLQEKRNAQKSLMNFYEDIKYNNIVVAVFKTEREAMEYVFVGGNDNQEILNNIEFLIKKAENKEDYDWKKAENVLKINDRYFVLQW